MMAQTVAIWRLPVTERRAIGSLWLTWFLLALGLLGAASAASDSPKARLLFAFFTAVPVGMLLIMWWYYLCRNVQLQCHPAALQLVPALRQRMVRAVVLAWAAIVVVMTLLAGVPTGYPLQVAIVTALVLIETSFAGTGRSILLWVALAVLPQVTPTIGSWLAWFLATPAGLAASSLLVLVDGAAALRRLARTRSAAPVAPPCVAPLQGHSGRPAGRLDRATDSQPAFLQPLGRSWFGSHWSTIAGVAVACAVVRVWAAAKGPAGIDFLMVQRTLLAVAMPCLLALFVYREAQRFAKARTEQALLSLTPGAPDRTAMNRLLAGLLLRGFARSWLILGLLALAALALLGAQPAGLARMCAVWLATLPLATVAMRDFARARGAPGLAATPLMTLLVFASSVGIHGMGAPAVWLALAAGGVVSALLLTRWRWHVMLAAAPALPAGRVEDNRSVR